MITNKEIFDAIQKNYNGDHVFYMADVIRKVMDAKYDEPDSSMNKEWKIIMIEVRKYHDGFITKYELYNCILNVVLRMNIPDVLYGQDWYVIYTFVDTIYNLIEDHYAH